MKKLLFLAVTLLFAGSAFAQDSPTIASSSDGRVSLNVLSHLGYGFHIVKSDDFSKAASGEFFINLLELEVHPIAPFGFSLGMDFKQRSFGSKKDSFQLDADKKIQAVPFPGGYDKQRSTFGVSALSFPVLAKLYVGEARLGAGVEANVNLGGRTYNYAKKDNVRTQVMEKKAKIERFNYGLMAFASYDDLGLFVKFYPNSSRLLPEGSVDLHFWTVGLVLGL